LHQVAIPSSDPLSVVLRYLDRMVAHDWEAMAECLHPDVIRVGPFGDTYTPRRPYVEYLASLLPTLINYDLTIARTVTRDSVVMVQLAETMELHGSMDVTQEVLVFDADATGLITRIDIFIQRST
jgi:SnoaL-like domain